MITRLSLGTEAEEKKSIGLPSESLPLDSPGAGPEWALLLECARSKGDASRLAELVCEQVDWSAFLALAEEHAVLGLVVNRFRDCDVAVVPQEIRQRLRDRHREQMLFSLHLTGEMFRLLERFASAGIDVLVIKGAVLSVRCYGDPGIRQYSDLDLVVRGNDILRSTELMTTLGYMPGIPPAAIKAAKTAGEYAFRQPDTRLLVEFHTDRTFRYYPRPLPLETLFGRQVRVMIDGRKVPVLSVEDELVLICIHAAKHFWGRLMWIADVAALISRQKVDWDKAVMAAQEVDAVRMLHVGLQLAADLTGAQLPQAIAAAVQVDRGAARLCRQIQRRLPAAASIAPGILARAMFRMSMRGGALSGAGYLLRLAFSPTEEDWTKGTEGERSSILDVLRRPFRLARKYSRDGKHDPGPPRGASSPPVFDENQKGPDSSSGP